MQVPHLPLQHVVGTCNGAGGLTPQWGGGAAPHPQLSTRSPCTPAMRVSTHAAGRVCTDTVTHAWKVCVGV